MDWIWQNYSEENLFVINSRISPYFEVFRDKTENQNIIFVNYLIRFEEIFKNYRFDNSEINLNEYGSTAEEAIANIAVHFLAELDMLNGISSDLIILDMIRNEIKNGAYGSEVKELFFSDCVTDEEREDILRLLLKRYENDQIEPTLGQIFTRFFDTLKLAVPNGNETIGDNDDTCYAVFAYAKPSPEIYYRKSTETTYYFSAYNKVNHDKFILLKLLFADVNDNIEERFGKNFGLISNQWKHTASYPEIGNVTML